MADLFLHLPFARRLRFAEGLHPLPGEAIGRRPALVVLGAALAGLPENERRGMSWLRRLFSGGGEAARWQKLLAPTPGQPHLDVIVALLSPEDAALGPLARLALGLGVLSHEILEEKIGSLTSSLQGPQRAAVERAQARLWLQSAIPGHLEGEWKPVLELADADANKRALQHVDRALKSVHGSGPGEAALGRWLKGLAAEVGPLAEGRGPAGALPPSLSLSDHEARAAHFEQVQFVEKAQSAVATIVGVANRLGEAFTKGSPDRSAIKDAIQKLAEQKNGEAESARARWKEWIQGSKEASLTRGRNPKPAFAEGEAIAEHHRVPAMTAVMRLSDLPPESEATSAPPIPESSGPSQPMQPVPKPPALTQEVSLAQIEAEAARDFQTPAHTQEVSVAQIESLVPVAATPDATQEVQTHQVIESAKTTRPISADDIAAANAADMNATEVTQPTPATAPPDPQEAKPPEPAVEAKPEEPANPGGGPTSTHLAPPDGVVADKHENNGVNGTHTETSEPTAPSPASPPQPEDPPRE